MSSGSGAVVIVVFWIVVHANYPYCCQEQSVTVVDDEMVVAFSGLGITIFFSSGSGVVVIIVFGVFVSKLDIWGLLLKIDSVTKLFCHKQAVVIGSDVLAVEFSGLGVTSFVISSVSGAMIMLSLGCCFHTMF